SSVDGAWIIADTRIYDNIFGGLFLCQLITYTRRPTSGSSENGLGCFWVDGVWRFDGSHTNCKWRGIGIIYILSANAGITMVLYRACTCRVGNLDSSIWGVYQCCSLAKTAQRSAPSAFSLLCNRDFHIVVF